MPDSTETQTHMDELCDVCGDTGVTDAIFTCSQCGIAREHRYCMRNHLKDVSPVWHCEECERSSETVSPKLGVKKDTPNASMSNFSGMVHHETKRSGSAGLNKLPNKFGRFRINWEKKVEKGKVKYIPAQEAIILSSGTKKFESPSRTDLRLCAGSSKTMASTSGRTPIKPKARSPKFSSQKVTANPTFGFSRDLKPLRPGNTQICSMVQQKVVPQSIGLKGNNTVLAPTKERAHMEQPMNALKPAEETETSSTEVEKAKENNTVLSPSKECSQMGQPMNALKPAEETETSNTKVEKAKCKAPFTSSLSMHCPSTVISGGNVCISEEPENFVAENRNMMNIMPKVGEFFHSDPALHVSWKGRFKLQNSLEQGEIIDGFLAHPPSKVHRKVYEFTKRMPEVLEFELLPRHNLRTDIFQDGFLDKNDIGLYFFPSSIKRYQSYSALLNFISMKDLVMRNYMNGVELLVLASRLLHVDSQKWNGDYFLWGIFRRVKMHDATLVVHPSNGADDSHAEGEASEAVDMDIDMIGGNNIGRADIVISKESFRRDCGSSRAETAIAITLHGSDAKFPAVSKNMDYTSQHPLLAVKKEVCDDIPPGFEETYNRRIRDKPCRATAISPAKENISLERAAELFGTSNLGTPKSRYSHLPGHPDEHHQAMDPTAVFSSPSSVKNTGFVVAIKIERPDDKRCVETEEKGSTGAPALKGDPSRSFVCSKLVLSPGDNCSSLQSFPVKIKTEAL